MVETYPLGCGSSGRLAQRPAVRPLHSQAEDGGPAIRSCGAEPDSSEMKGKHANKWIISDSPPRLVPSIVTSFRGDIAEGFLDADGECVCHSTSF